MVGDGGATFFYGAASGTTLTIVRVTASSSAYVETLETGTPALGASATAGALAWDGTNVLYVANENDAKLRLTVRTAQDTYTNWTDLVVTTLGTATLPAIERQLGGSDLSVFFRSNATQANGEIWGVQRAGGAWSAPFLVAGGDSSGFSSPSAATDDLNTAGRVRLVYRTGTASPYTLVENVNLAAPDYGAQFPYTFGEFNLGSGSYATHATDLTLPGRLLPFSFSRTYNSADARVSALGPAWSHSYDWAVTDSGSTVELRRGSGERDTFTSSGGGSYTNPPDVFDTLTKNGDGTYTLTLKNQVAYEFSTAGVLTRIHEPAGNQIVLGYFSGKLTSITDTVGRVITLGYTGSLLTQIQDPSGRKVTYAYDASGRLATVVDKIGNTAGQDPNLHSWRYGYDGTTRHLTSITDPDGRSSLRNTYDANGRIVGQRDGLDHLWLFSYGNGTTTTTDPRGHQTILTFDLRQRTLTQVDVVSGITRTLTYTYDTQGNRLSVTDRDANETDFTYDTRGNLLTKTDPLVTGQSSRYVTTYTYDAKNNLKTILDARNFTTTNDYDLVTNVLLSTTAQIDVSTNAITKYEYNDVANPGLPTTIVAPRGNINPLTPDYTYSQILNYDAQANLATRVDADGALTRYCYDTVGRRTSMVDPDGTELCGAGGAHTWLTVYDPNDRVTTETDPLGHSTLTGYNATGDRLTSTDRNGNVTTYTYDSAARLATVQQKPDPVNQPTLVYTTTITRDANGNATSVLQANGVVTDSTFDELNQLKSAITHPTGSTQLTTSYVLNGNGQPTTKATGDGVAITYVYDQMARLKSVSAAGLTTISYGYDELSHRTSMVDGTGSTSYSYDGLGRLTQAIQPNGTTSYGYDRDSNRTTLTYPTVGNVTYVFSPGGRLSTVTDWAGHSASYQYTNAGLASSVSVPGGMTTSYTYDTVHRLTLLTNMVGAATVSSHSYTLDNEGNRTALDEIVANPLSVKTNDDVGTTAQDHPAIAVGADGAGYLVWDDARLGNTDIEFARADPLTGAWSANTKVNTDTGTRAQLNPAVAVDGGSNAYVIWQDDRDGANNNINTNIYFAKRLANGTWNANVKVNDDSGGSPAQTKPRIAVTTGGVASAVWVDPRSNQLNIYGSTLAAGSNTWAANKKVTVDNTAAVKDNPDVAVGADGTTYAVWQDSRNGNPDISTSPSSPPEAPPGPQTQK